MISYSNGVIVSTDSSNLTTTKDSDNKEHYCFTGSELCEVSVNWQAKIKDAQGKEAEVDCSITFLINEDGIKEIVGEPMFGGITDKQEVLELVRQNKEVFINGNSLYNAITKNVSSQTKGWNDTSSGYSKRDSISSIDSGIADLDSTSTPFSNRSLSFGYFPTLVQTVGSEEHSSIDMEFEGYGIIPESPSSSAFLGRRLLSRRNSLEADHVLPVKNKTEQLIKNVKELELEVDELKQENVLLTKRKKDVEEERTKYSSDLYKAEEKVEVLTKQLNDKDEASKKRIKELLEKQVQVFEESEREVKDREQKIKGLEKRISNLTTKLAKLDEALKKEKDEKLRKSMKGIIESVKNKYGEELTDYALNWERDFQHAVRNNVKLLISGLLKDQENGLETQKTIEEAIDALSSTDVYTEAKVLNLEGDLQDEKEKNLNLEKGFQDEKTKVFNLEKKLQAEQKKSSNLERDLQAEKAKVLNLEKGFQNEKTNVFNLEKTLQNEHAKLSGLSKDLKSEGQKVADLKKRNSTNISKAKRALSTAALLIGLVYLFSQVQSIELSCVLCMVFLTSLVYCIYNICTMNEDHSHDLSVSRAELNEGNADSKLQEDIKIIKSTVIGIEARA